ncbi:Tim44 domain-containing protein [Noviherbaspirillum soli]|uniref:Tim44 domain-containing protein n=1 Tax=Noviherbaspirillum soli TaxID=1064518 RepID=UPI00188B2717|nr:Tim44-like domain-containing protein [Noviherbaspirillum soli]
MKKVVMGVMVAVMAVSIGLSSAEAKRMGSGSSVGKQSQSVNQAGPSQSAAPAQSAAAPAAARPATPAATPPKPASPWKGMLGGALLGLGLGALLSSMGIGGALASMISTILMVGLLVMAGLFIYRMVRSKSQGGQDSAGLRPAYAGAQGMQQSVTPEIGSHLEQGRPSALQSQEPVFGGAAAAATQASAPWGVPADFDTQAFLRHAKTYFIRLQAAWDKADTNDIREFTTPEMFAELRMQIQERGASPNHTDVVTLDAQLLGIENSGADHLASVKFSGMIREMENAPAEPFAEVWNLTKPASGQGGWTLAGIQQLS